MLVNDETMMATGTTQLDNKILWRIIRALELVKMIEGEMRHSKDVSELKMEQLHKEVDELKTLVKEKEKRSEEDSNEQVRARSATQVALIQALPALFGGALMYLLTKWLGG